MDINKNIPILCHQQSVGSEDDVGICSKKEALITKLDANYLNEKSVSRFSSYKTDNKILSPVDRLKCNNEFGLRPKNLKEISRPPEKSGSIIKGIKRKKVDCAPAICLQNVQTLKKNDTNIQRSTPSIIRMKPARKLIAPSMFGTKPVKKQSGLIEKRVMDAVQGYNQTSDPMFTEQVILDEGVDDEDLALIRLEDRNRKIIDSGSFACVFPFTSKKGVNLAVKEFDKRDGKTPEMDFQQILAPWGLRHHHGIVKVMAIVCTSIKFWIVMEDAGLSLKKMMRNADFITYKDQNFARLVMELFKICSWLEIHEFCHRDLKPENVTVRKKGNEYELIFVDFGSCQPSQDKPKPAGFTPEYLPPKLVALISQWNKDHSVDFGQEFLLEHGDAWACSLIALFMFYNGRHPIDDVNRYSLDPEILSKQRQKVREEVMEFHDGWCDAKIGKVTEPVATVLRNTLKVDSTRWTAKMGVTYMQNARFKKPKVDSSDLMVGKGKDILVSHADPIGGQTMREGAPASLKIVLKGDKASEQLIKALGIDGQQQLSAWKQEPFQGVAVKHRQIGLCPDSDPRLEQRKAIPQQLDNSQCFSGNIPNFNVLFCPAN